MEHQNNNLEYLQISELETINETLERSYGHPQLETENKTIKVQKKLTVTIMAVTSIMLLLGINFTLDVYQSYSNIAQSSVILANAYLIIYLIAVIGLSLYVISSFKSYINLKSAFKLQSRTLNIDGYEQEREVSLLILNHYIKHQDSDIQKKAQNLYAKVSSNSLHSPFVDIKNEIVNELDKKASKEVYTSAKEISLFTAFSPGSALDSLVVIYSSLKLMKKIFHIYGYKTNFFTLLIIIRKILENASIAALIEYADDSVNELLGNTLMSKISTKIAQGMGNGILALRIGNILIQSARPFASDGSIGSYKQMVQIFVKYIKEKVRKKS